MPDTCTEDTTYDPIFVARQPIYDTDNDVWGYELLFRHSGDTGVAQVADNDLATSKVIADGFTLAMGGTPPEKRALINFPARLLLDDTALALPKDRCVVEILEDVIPSEEILAACKRLKDAGYLLALDDFTGQEELKPLLSMVDIIKVEVLGMSKSELMKVASGLKKYSATLLAEKIEDRDTLAIARSLGFTLFQGFYFCRPEIVPGRKISATMVAKVQLLGALSKPEVEFDELAQIISRDVSLSYRLLQFINSSAFSFRTKIQSISQAVTLLGLGPFRQWSMVVVMSDMDMTPKGEELTYLSLQRARFLEQIGCRASSLVYSTDTMFLLGLFSKLDALLGQEMAEVLDKMDLEDEIKAALCGDNNNPAYRWLLLLQSVESGDWQGVDEFMAEKQLRPKICAVEYLRASSWARQILGLAAKQQEENNNQA